MRHAMTPLSSDVPLNSYRYLSCDHFMLQGEKESAADFRNFPQSVQEESF